MWSRKSEITGQALGIAIKTRSKSVSDNHIEISVGVRRAANVCPISDTLKARQMGGDKLRRYRMTMPLHRWNARPARCNR